jgi:hypothetical protein
LPLKPIAEGEQVAFFGWFAIDSFWEFCIRSEFFSRMTSPRFAHHIHVFHVFTFSNFKILENTSFLAPSENTRISYVTTMEILTFLNNSNNHGCVWRSSTTSICCLNTMDHNKCKTFNALTIWKVM